MYLIFDKSRRGFTLAETLIAVSLGIALSLIIVIIVSSGLKSIRGASETEFLHSDAVFIANALTYWVKQASIVEVAGSPPAMTLTLTMPDSTQKAFAQNGTELQLDGAPINTEDSEVERLEFTELERSVRFAFTLKAPDSPLRFSATSTVAKRN